MIQQIYQVIIYDSEKNSFVDPFIFWDMDAAVREARRIHDDPEIESDSIRVYKEVADSSGGFRPIECVFRFHEKSSFVICSYNLKNQKHVDAVAGNPCSYKR